MVSEWDIEQALNDTTSDENQTDGTTTTFSDIVDARINDAMGEWFCHLQEMSGNIIS